ncbi:hypothetical protein GCM10009347_42870 [Shewanella algicola]|uniref:Uncharacterized protein n=1 Tax=Shewanella algicola TaxID=640633 RepID=A0A9X2CFY1_9GAMM|nr:hypothetical protein [Shewanella algicola]MCL1107862.1 hypothetical protein [Shewanella algicola]GGP74118.1 hypothetical protein GCM10009347_42870 [Shewanella algicola]|tara:strand:- start:9019 stop:9168 length:150 start_codon:yes stop_codon:yes gene_type:complete
MKLIVLALGVVGGIYLTLMQPDIAMQILDGFIQFINWLSISLSSLLRGV